MTLDVRACEAVRHAVSGMKRPLLISHVNPDGDALGSLAAMRSLLTQRGAKPTALLFDEIPRRYSLFDTHEAWTWWDANAPQPECLTHCDGVIVMDTCTYNQLLPVATWLKSSRVPKVAIDHHVTRDDLADTYLIDEPAAATCLILFEWARAVDWTLTPGARDDLFIGIATDTGWFTHSNTDARALSAAGKLVAQGVVAHQLHRALYQNESPARIHLLAAALDTMELLADGQLSAMTLSSTALRGAGAAKGDSEDIINEPMRIGSVRVSAFFVEQDDGVIRVSLRSKPPTTPPEGADCHVLEPDIDVAKVAREFGGGGHARAAGAKIPGSLSDVRRLVIERLGEELRRCGLT